MTSVIVHHGDSREVLKTIPDASIDSCVCDPPYALVSIAKRLGKDGSVPIQFGKDGAYARAAKGFMGKSWDTGETAFDPDFWREVMRVLKPGGHVIAASGTRTYHRLACAVEDAGFEIRDTIMWNYGSGFPKSHNIVKRLQQSGLSCSCRKTIVSGHHVSDENLRDLRRGLDAHFAPPSGSEQDVRQGVHGGPGARASSGAENPVRDMRGDDPSTAIAPEPQRGDILQRVVPIKGLRRSAAPDVREHEGAQTSAPVQGDEPGVEGRCHPQATARELQGRQVCESAAVGAPNGAEGRVHHGASPSYGEDVRFLADADRGGGSRGPQSGEQRPCEPEALPNECGSQAWGGWPVCPGCLQPVVPEGYGTALKPACEPWVLARKPLDGTVAANVLKHGVGALNIDGARVGWSGSADERESKTKNAHADFGSGPRGNEIFGADGRDRGANGNYNPPGRWPANVIHDGSAEVSDAFGDTSTSRIGQPRSAAPGEGWGMSATGAEYSDSGSAARFFYTAKADAEDRMGSKHPTIKPVNLMAYLCRLVTPPGGTVLDPFAGSGSTGVACIGEGFNAILIEREAEYVADIHRRIAWVKGDGRLTAQEVRQPAQDAESALPLFVSLAGAE
jgi:DNA modification methylase